MPENMKKEIAITHYTTSVFFVTFLQLGVAWPFLTNEKLAKGLFLDNKRQHLRRRKTLLFPLFYPPETWRGDSEERLPIL